MINRTHHDLFEKLLQDMARIIAELLGHHTEDPLVALEQAKQHYLQLQEKELALIPAHELLDYLLEKDYSHAQLEITAGFLLAEAKVHLSRTDKENGQYKLRQAEVIYEYLEEHSEIYSDPRREAIRSIKELQTA